MDNEANAVSKTIDLSSPIKHKPSNDKDEAEAEQVNLKGKLICSNNGHKISAKMNVAKNAADVRRTVQSGGKESNQLEYYKRTGAMSVTGELYVTKLLSLILLRFINTENIAEFYLGANITEAEPLDDLCFKYKPVKSDKPIIVFLQTKHKINPDKGKITMSDVHKIGGDFNVEKHFESYLKIRQKFSPKSNDVIFKGVYHDSQCFFVIYTPLKHSIDCKKPLKQNDINKEVKNLIQTNRSVDVFQLDYKDADTIALKHVERKVHKLGKAVLNLIHNGCAYLSDSELIQSYHVVLAQKVINVTHSDGEGIRGKFRSEFFENKEKLMTIFRESLFDEVVNNKSLHATEGNVSFLNGIYDNPSVEDICRVIGNVVSYNKKTNQLELLDDKLRDNKEFEFLKHGKVNPLSIRNAINIKGKAILEHLEFDLPAGFGNNDLILKGDAEDKEDRIVILAATLGRLFESAVYSNGVNLIDINEVMVVSSGIDESGILEHKDDLGSALGNLLIWDRDTNALKFNSSDPLPEFASKLWSKLKSIYDEKALTTYRLKFRIKGFPKAYIEENWYEEYLVEDFIDHYWLCTGQAKEDTVENIAKMEVKEYLNTQVGDRPIFRATTDAIFLMLHDTMQKWWMLPNKAYYLTKDSEYLQRATSEVVDSPLLSVLNLICLNKLQSNAIEFNDDAVKSLRIHEALSGVTLIATDSVTQTATKLIQHFNHVQNCIFIDFNYVTDLMFNVFQNIAQEVTNSSVNTIIIMCKVTDKDERVESICEAFAHFVQNLEKKSIIVIVDTPLYTILKTDLTCTYHEIKDHKNSLNNLSRDCQEKILTESKVICQGEEVNLKSIIDQDSKRFMTSHILQKLVNKETLEIGKPLKTSNYAKIKQFYVERNVIVSRNSNETKSDESVPLRSEVRTLKDLDKDIVVVTAPPGMGKSTLLTHLSLETKKRYPEVWIARINLLRHSKQFHQWKKHKTNIDKAEALAFLCKAACNGDIGYEFINTDEGFEVKRGDLSAEDLLQADLFVHCYMKGKAIILFDGFDEICPLYEAEVIQLIKITANVVCDDRIMKPKLWIASRSYNNVQHVIEREFRSSYSLEPLSQMDHQIYLNKLWRKSMRLDEFTHEQLLNVNSFIDYMRQFWHLPGTRLKPIGLKSITLALYDMYSVAVQYFQNEISNIMITPEKEMFKENWNLRSAYPSVRRYGAASTRLDADFAYVKSLCQMSGSPLHIHIAAEFFGNQIKYNLTNYDTNKWDLGNNTFFIYEQFLETKLLKIRFEEKNRIDIYNPDNIGMHERERKEFIDMHRKLAFYSIFQEKSNVLMSERQLSDVNQMIDRIKYATEKTGVIDCVVDGVPRFVHLIFAEYFAVDYVCSTLKMAFSLHRSDIQETIWQFILSPSFREASLGFTNIFDYKIILDAEMKEILEHDHSKKIGFDKLMAQATAKGDIQDLWNNLQTIILDILSRGMKYVGAFLLKSIMRYLDKGEVDKFVSFISYDEFLTFILHRGLEQVVRLTLDYLRDVNLLELERALKNNGLEYGSQLAMIETDQMIADLRQYTLVKRFPYSSVDSFRTTNIPVVPVRANSNSLCKSQIIETQGVRWVIEKAD